MFTTFAFLAAATISWHSLDVHRQGLLAKNRLAVARRLEGDLAMAVVGSADVDDMNFGVAHDSLPIRARVPPTKLFAGGFDIFGRTTADGVKHNIRGQIKKLRCLAPCVRMRLSHEVVTDHSDIERAFGHTKGEESRLHQMPRRLKTKKIAHATGVNRLPLAATLREISQPLD